MSTDSTRVVLGFYAGEEEYAQQAWRAIRPLSQQAHYYRSNGEVKSPTPASQKYSFLRLNDEDLVVAEVDSAKVPSVVGILPEIPASQVCLSPAVTSCHHIELWPAVRDEAAIIIYSWRR